MASSSSIHLTLLLFFTIATASCSAFNVTTVLGPLPEFSTFSNFLAQAGVFSMIADLNNVTILAVDNANMAPMISGKSRAEINRIMTMHVIPEYYDLHRLNALKNGTALVRTVHTLTGLARGKDGMLLVTKRGKLGRFAFASAVLPRSKPNVNLVKSVVVRSPNVSVLHVSGLIVTPPPVVSVGSDVDGGRIAPSGKLMVRRSFVPKETTAAAKKKVRGGMKLEVGDEEGSIFDFTEKAESSKQGAPAKSPAKSKSPAKAPSPTKSSNSTSDGKKGRSPSPAPSSDSPAPAPSKKKSGGPSPAPSKDAPSKSPKGAKSSAPSPSDSPAPSKSGDTSSSPSSDSPSSESSAAPADDSTSKSSPPAPPSESDSDSSDADSPIADAPADGPTSWAGPNTVSRVGMLMTVMALWALTA